MGRRLAWLSTALVLLAGLGYQMLVHAAVTGSFAPWLRIGLKLLPLAGLALWAVLRARRKAAWLGGIALAALAIWWLDSQPESSAAAYGLPHAAVYFSLLCLFGRTLMAGQTALVTQMALRVHGQLLPPVLAYTRGVTVAWCVFFAGELAASALLFCFAPRGAWALFITVLHFPLVLLMFVLEYAVRRLWFPDAPTTSIPRAIRAFMDHTDAPPEAPQGSAAP